MQRIWYLGISKELEGSIREANIDFYMSMFAYLDAIAFLLVLPLRFELHLLMSYSFHFNIGCRGCAWLTPAQVQGKLVKAALEEDGVLEQCGKNAITSPNLLVA